MKTKALVWMLLLLFGWAAAVGAESVFVRNKPFKGVTRGAGMTCEVELLPFAEALGFTVKPCNGGFLVTSDAKSDQGSEECEAGLALVDGNKVTVTSGAGGESLVSMQEFCSSVGAKIVPNREMGTVDVYLESNSKARAPSLKDKWGSKGDASKAGASKDDSLPEGPGKVCVQFFQVFSALPPMRDLKEMRELNRKQAEVDQFKAKLENFLTPELFGKMYPRYSAVVDHAMESSTLLSGIPQEQLETGVAHSPDLTKKVLAAMKNWENMRATSATFLKQKLMGNQAFVLVEASETDKDDKVSKSKIIVLLVLQNGKWKVGGLKKE